MKTSLITSQITIGFALQLTVLNGSLSLKRKKKVQSEISLTPLIHKEMRLRIKKNSLISKPKSIIKHLLDISMILSYLMHSTALFITKRTNGYSIFMKKVFQPGVYSQPAMASLINHALDLQSSISSSHYPSSLWCLGSMISINTSLQFALSLNNTLALSLSSYKTISLFVFLSSLAGSFHRAQELRILWLYYSHLGLDPISSLL